MNARGPTARTRDGSWSSLVRQLGASCTRQPGRSRRTRPPSSSAPTGHRSRSVRVREVELLRSLQAGRGAVGRGLRECRVRQVRQRREAGIGAHLERGLLDPLSGGVSGWVRRGLSERLAASHILDRDRPDVRVGHDLGDRCISTRHSRTRRTRGRVRVASECAECQRAYSTARDSRITVTLICPGYSSSFSISRAIS
jgi:hypothetical protein